MGAYYVGLDIHSQLTTFVIEDDTGTIVARGAVPTTSEGFARLCQAHQLPAGTTVALETGTSSFYVARVLAELQLTPVVIDAHEVRLKAHRPAQKRVLLAATSWGATRTTPWCTAHITAVLGGPPLVFIDTVWWRVHCFRTHTCSSSRFS
jgi:hypothetical protein